MHAEPRDLGGDLEPIAAQIGLTADQGDFARTGRRQLADHVETFRCGKFVGPALAGPRSAVAAFEISGERNFPDHVDRHMRISVFRGPDAERVVP
jgi:hypothetical protein